MGLLHCFLSVIRSLFPNKNPPSRHTGREPESEYVRRSVDGSLSVRPGNASPVQSFYRDEATPMLHLVDGDSRLSALCQLQDELKAARVASVERPHEFIPHSIVKQLVCNHVHNILLEEHIVPVEQMPYFAQEISQHSPKLFAILVDRKKEKDIIFLLREGLSDTSLPFVRVEQDEQSSLVLLTRQGKRIKTLDSWDNDFIKSFEIKQHRMLGPVFRQGAHYELSVLDILPFVKTTTTVPVRKAGGFGEVFQRCIHPDHHDFSNYPTQEGLLVADKRMFDASDFEPERKVYQALGPTSHPHFITLLFTYKHGRSCHLVFPWAEGTLKDYWKSNSMPRITDELLIWSLKQMSGIASGLSFFHEFTSPMTSASNNPRFGLHGDIKSENILRFQGPNDRGTLKIADLGLASIHGKASKSNIDPNTVVLSPTYSPPEKDRKHLVSRKWDIWSLGCLYLEHITWLVCGYQAILEFSNRRLDDSISPIFRSDYFFTPDNESVRPSVISWVHFLKRNPRCSLMMHSVLDMIMTKMIIIQPEQRSSSHEICRELKQILNRAENDSNYLLCTSTEAMRASSVIHATLTQPPIFADPEPQQQPRSRDTWPMNKNNR